MANEDDTITRFELLAASTLADPPPDDLAHRCGELFTWRTFEGELAALVEESAGAEVRSGEGRASLTFESPGYLLQVDIVPGEGMLGDISPPAAGLTVETPSASSAVRLDDHGRFRTADVPTGPFRLVARGPDGDVVVTTDWITG